MTATELLTIARRDKPRIEYATNPKRSAIAGRKPGAEWEVCAVRGIDGKWYSAGNLWIDGKPVFELGEFDPAIA